MLTNRVVENVFFFGLLGMVGYLVWEILTPFFSALAVAAIIVTIAFPLYKRVQIKMPWQSESIAALVTTLLVFLVMIIPLFLIASALVNEAVAVYRVVSPEQIGFEESLQSVENTVQHYIPGFALDITDYLQQITDFLAGNLQAIFTGTASTIFLFFIALIGTYYLFKDGEELMSALVRISPLPDEHDDEILRRLAQSMRSVLTGVVLVALIQGSLTAIGLWMFGFERAVLWGAIAAFGALIPSVGTSIVFIPAVLFLIFSGAYLGAIGLALWGVLAVGLIDNLLGPYFMSRGNALHPFIILLAVLGGISLFGPIGFIAGPVIVTLFMVLLELYAIHIAPSEPITHD